MKLRILLLLSMMIAGVGPVRADVASPVDRVEVLARDGFTQVVVHFLWPITLRSHTPLARGENLEIELSFVPGAGALVASSVMPPWRGGGEPGARGIYREIRLDGALDRATLSLDLAAIFDFEVRRGADARSLVINVLHEDVAPQQASRPAAAEDLSSLSEVAASARMEEADRAMLAGDLDRAVALYTNIVGGPDGPETRAALEKLGVARERKGQLAHAKAIYQDYLQRYPGSAQAARVSQRLESLLAVDRPLAGGADTTVAGRASSRADWQVYGAWSQYYRYADQSIDRSGSPYFYGSDQYTAQSDLLSRLDLRARHKGQTWGVDARFGGGYLSDFHDDDSSNRGSEVLLSDASVEFSHLDSEIAVRLGRQYSSGEGVLGRFDGARLEIPFAGQWQLNLMGGRPVDLISDTAVDESDRYFYGMSLNLQPEDSAWEYGLFVTEQRIDGIEDRQAVGGELRYATVDSSLFTLLDYDTGYGELNTFLLIGNLTFETGTVLGATVDYRLSPLLTTRNALIGQPVDSIDELLDMFRESEIRDLAQDRTADSHAVTLSVMHPLSERYQLYGSVSEFEYGDTSTSGGVEGYPGTGSEYGYEAQLIASNLWLEDDTHVFSLRYYEGKTSERLGFGINARYRIGAAWRVQPRLWIERREISRDSSDQWSLRPSLRVEYQWGRRYHIELEVGRDWSQRDIPVYGQEELGSNYLLFSYRIDID